MVRSTAASTPQHQCKACDIWIGRSDIKSHRKSQPHIDICKRKDLYYCHPCDKAFLDGSGFRAHNKSCHKPGIPAAGRAPPTTSTRTANIHVDNCKARFLYCDECKNIFDTTTAQNFHICETPSPRPSVPAQYPCPNCSQVFERRKLRTEHKKDCLSDSRSFPHWIWCTACQAHIKSEDVTDHKLSQEHINNSKLKGLYCHLCELSFMGAPGLHTHETTSAMHKANLRKSGRQCGEPAVVPTGTKYCVICNADYVSATKDHLCTKAHVDACKEKNLYCTGCNSTFPTDPLRKLHVCRPSAFYCCDCDQNFPTNSQFIKHLKKGCDLKETTFKCDPCDLAFSTRKQLNVHLNSKNHKTLKCLGSTNCERKFKRLSDMIQHLESGACVSKFNRATIDGLVRSHDTAGAITIKDSPTRPVSLIGPDGSHFGGGLPECTAQIVPDDDFDEGDIILTPETILTPASTPSRRSCTASTPTGVLTPTISEFEFQLENPKTCPICRRTFASVTGLHMHIASPVHAVSIYHCPIDFLGELGLVGKNKNKKERVFRTLSGLAQHIEAGACSGGRETWEKAIEFLEGKLAGFGLAGVKLLEQ
ncbi:hypothetical protein K440DRAFT_131761 [Wilcoxina mikolae CBS 423.85]|nr:hypothetical protein K440DRAFT_131761 [Wilcoxina mikolae CBS 423.85]